MSGALPDTTFSGIKISSEQKTLINNSISGKRFVRQIDGQKWRLQLSYPPQTRSDFADVMAFILKQRSSKESFTITLPSTFNAKGNETGSVLVNGVHAIGDTTIAMDGFSSDGSERFKAGDFIKFAGHNKLYMVVADVTSSSNASTVTIEPPLTTALANNEGVTYDSVTITVYLASDLQEFTANDLSDSDLVFNYSFDVIEAI